MAKKLKAVSVIISVVLIVISLFFLNKSPVLNGENLYVYTIDGSFCNGVKIQNSRFPFIKTVKGESYVLDGENFSVQEFFNSLKGKILLTENTAEGISYYGFSKKIKYAKKLNGKKINIHLYVRDDYVKVGFPIIYGAY